MSEPAPTTEVTRALIVDVDGVVSPVRGHTAWGDDVVAGTLFGSVLVSPAMCARLDAAAQLPGVVALWLTSWSEDARARMDPFPGRGWSTLADQWPSGAAASESPWWKWQAVESWLISHPQIRTVVWCEDHLSAGPHEEDEVRSGGEDSRRDEVRAELTKMNIGSLLIAPETDVGLTPAHLDLIEERLGATGPEGD